jgi:hypothetical protein
MQLPPFVGRNARPDGLDEAERLALAETHAA